MLPTCTIGKYGYLRNVHGTFITYIHNVEHIKNIGISKFENTCRDRPTNVNRSDYISP